MQPDGSQQQRAPGDAVAAIDQLYAQQQWSTDGTTLLYVANAPDRADTNLFLVHADLPVTTVRDVMLTDFPGAEYDPVWSPSSTAIAFVANHTGNDEVWVMNADWWRCCAIDVQRMGMGQTSDLVTGWGTDRLFLQPQWAAPDLGDERRWRKSAQHQQQ